MTTHRTWEGAAPAALRSEDRDASPVDVDVVWRDGVPFASTDEVMAGVDQLLVRDAELLRRLAE